jgi:hypothetical protein
MQGFLILNCIIGGQTLAGVSDHLNATLGIVIIGVVSMVVGGILLCSLRRNQYLLGNILWLQSRALVG